MQEFIQTDITLQGAGQVLLSDKGENIGSATVPSVTLTNLDNMISGAGPLVAGEMTPINTTPTFSDTPLNADVGFIDVTITDGSNTGEAPPATQGPTSLNFDINAPMLGEFELGNSLPDNTIVGTFTATGDLDSTILTYALTGTDINASTGGITATDQAGNAGPAIPVNLFVGTTDNGGTVATPIAPTVGPDIALGFNGNDLIAGQNNDTIFINGGDNDDELYGGAGSDTLTGGNGNDNFRFFSPTEGVDTIFDFSKVGGNTDKIYLDDAGFTAIGPSLDDAEFLSGAGVTTATTSTQRIIYDSSSGALYYDADGSSAGAAVQILNLGVNTHPNLTASDFQIF